MSLSLWTILLDPSNIYAGKQAAFLAQLDDFGFGKASDLDNFSDWDNDKLQALLKTYLKEKGRSMFNAELNLFLNGQPSISPTRLFTEEQASALPSTTQPTQSVEQQVAIEVARVTTQYQLQIAQLQQQIAAILAANAHATTGEPLAPPLLQPPTATAAPPIPSSDRRGPVAGMHDDSMSSVSADADADADSVFRPPTKHDHKGEQDRQLCIVNGKNIVALLSSKVNGSQGFIGVRDIVKWLGGTTGYPIILPDGSIFSEKMLDYGTKKMARSTTLIVGPVGHEAPPPCAAGDDQISGIVFRTLDELRQLLRELWTSIDESLMANEQKLAWQRQLRLFGDHLLRAHESHVASSLCPHSDIMVLNSLFITMWSKAVLVSDPLLLVGQTYLLMLGTLDVYWSSKNSNKMHYQHSWELVATGMGLQCSQPKCSAKYFTEGYCGSCLPQRTDGLLKQPSSDGAYAAWKKSLPAGVFATLTKQQCDQQFAASPFKSSKQAKPATIQIAAFYVLLGDSQSKIPPPAGTRLEV